MRIEQLAELHQPLYVPDLLVNALGQDPSRPLLQMIGGPMLTVGDVRNATSQFAQALKSLGVEPGVRVGILSTNRPEVLHAGHALQLLAAVSMPLHPLSGIDDHAYAITDAQIKIL